MVVDLSGDGLRGGVGGIGNLSMMRMVMMMVFVDENGDDAASVCERFLRNVRKGWLHDDDVNVDVL